jgi:aspartyl-tRNA(Asn)/glutamyl-tRNA(Gln) amidotransferase subunit A
MIKIPKSIDEATKMFEGGELTPTQLVEHYFLVIEKENPKLNAVLEVFQDALVSARESDENFKNKKNRKLEGIPFLVKDCILVKNHIGSAGSQMLKDYVSPYDATVIKLIKENGGIILGRTNMDEFALGGSGENSSYGKTLNPIDNSKVPGGSSSGSAAALASGMCLLALGSDTGGSVRQPASFCGLYGFKPSYGGISRSGLIAAASSLDTIGVFANNSSDIEYIFNIVAHEDALDNTSIPENIRAEIKTANAKTMASQSKKVVAYPKEYVESEGLNEEVKKDFYNSLEKLEKLGYSVKPVSIDTLKYALSMYYIINTAEVSTNLSRMEGLRFGGGEVGDIKNYMELFSKNRGNFLGPEVKRRIMIGSYVLSHGYYDAFYGKSLNLRENMKQDFNKIFDEASIIIMPTAPTTAFTSGEIKDPLTLYLEDIFTVPANLVGVPAISIPTGIDSNNLPTSLQALAAFGCEENLFNFAKAFSA